MSKTKITSIMLLLVLVVALVLSLVIVTPTTLASAGDGYTSFFYFSDNGNYHKYFSSFMQKIVADYGISSQNMYEVLWDNKEGSTTGIENFYCGSYENDIVTISNAFIVVELIQWWGPIGEVLPYYQLLEDLFSKWKENNCKIMFIGGTDEIKFENHNEFLDYVDIHINLDIITLIMDTVCGKIKQEQADEIFDGSPLVSVWSLIIHPDSFDFLMSEYIAALFAGNSNWLDDSEKPYIMSDLLCNHINVATEENEYCESDKTMLLSGRNVDHGMLSMWLSLYKYSDYPAYILNETLQSFGDVDDGIYEAGAGVYTFYHDTYGEDYDPSDESTWTKSMFETIFYDFIMDNDLSVYANWDGRCTITYKPVIIDPDGWLMMYCIGEHGCWYIWE